MHAVIRKFSFFLFVHAEIFQKGLPKKENNFQFISHLFPYFCDNTTKILSYNLFENDLKKVQVNMNLDIEVQQAAIDYQLQQN